MNVETEQSFDKDWRKVKDATTRQRLTKAITAGIENESDSADIVTVVGRPGFYRLRVGDWRILFYVENATAILVRLVPRGQLHQATKRL